MENNQENLPPIIQPEPPKPLDKKWIVATALILVVVGISYIAFSRPHIQQQVVSETNTPDLKPGWKVYQNSVLGLEFSYPESWGEPYTSPDYITDINSLTYGSDNKPHTIDIRFKNSPYLVYITLFNDLSTENNSVFGFRGNISSIPKNSDICIYNIYSSHNRPSSKVIELHNECNKGIKRTLIETTEDFSGASFSPPIGKLYTYDFVDFAFKKTGNTIYPYALIQYEIASLNQEKTQINFYQFMQNKIGKTDDSDFIYFINTFKSTGVSMHEKTKTSILSSDSADIKAVKTYYNLLANNDYQNAFSYLISPPETKEKFISSQNDIYDQIIKEVNQISNNTIEVFLDIQKHNQPPIKYRQVFEITNNKLHQTMEESINGEISVFGNMKAYASERGLQSVVVLQENGQERIVDSREHTSDTDGWSKFYSPYFSPKGRYIKYTIGYYEGSSSDIYDILNKKVLNKSIPNGNFNQEETLYFSCQFSEAYGPVEASIYTVPQFSVKTDLLKLHPELSKYWNYKCSNDEKTHVETFEFSGSYENNSYSTTTKEIYRFDSRTGEPLP